MKYLEGTSFSSYNGLGELIESVSSRTFKNVVTDVVPLTAMETALMRGDVNVLDVGCGRGFQMIELGMKTYS
ncbi:hypothetical protein AB6A40_011175 [Gnathostoma spinigerum]|uniref:Uncharacterized protein n=1 Tax=Gnathostoma spinigerum TaxID=75299 RepID=A0ABD6EYN0_9BILA